MSDKLQLKISPEVMSLKNLLDSSRRDTPGLWDSVESALNAADASSMSSVVEDENQVKRVTAATETTTAAIRLEKE
ncbi:MAG: hypothetical protein AB1814_05050 [Thermodesulfobacteriota bacterium]